MPAKMEYYFSGTKSCDVEIEVMSFVVNGIVKLTIPPIDSFLDFKFSRIHLAQIIFEFWVVYGQYIIDVPVSEIEPR